MFSSSSGLCRVLGFKTAPRLAQNQRSRRGPTSGIREMGSSYSGQTARQTGVIGLSDRVYRTIEKREARGTATCRKDGKHEVVCAPLALERGRGSCPVWPLLQPRAKRGHGPTVFGNARLTLNPLADLDALKAVDASLG